MAAGDIFLFAATRKFAQRAQDLHLLVANGIGLEGHRRLHRDQRNQLQHVILDDVARDAGTFEISAAFFHADRFGDSDLHMVNILTIPERLEDPVRKAQHEEVLNSLFAEVVVDAEDLALAERGHRDAVELFR